LPGSILAVANTEAELMMIERLAAAGVIVRGRTC